MKHSHIHADSQDCMTGTMGPNLLINKHKLTFCGGLRLVITPLERKFNVYENGWPVAGNIPAYAVCITNTTGHISLSIACQ